MANIFDQFDEPAPPPPPNQFDQFDNPAYTSSVLPFTYNDAGQRTFDPTVGALGAIGRAAKDAFLLPSQVASGQQPVIGPNGTDPGLNARAANFASFATPIEFGRAVPTAMELKNAGSGGYNAWRNSGLEFNGPSAGDLAQGIKDNLESDGIIAEHAPKTFAALNKAIGDATAPPGATSLATAANMQSFRRSFNNVGSDPTELKAATTAKQAIDGFLSGPPPGSVLAEPPAGAGAAANVFSNANANYAASQRSNALTGALDRANTGILDRAEADAAAANSGQNLDNRIRSRVRTFLQNPANVAGLTDAEIDALNGVVKGGMVQDKLRWIGNALGGGGGLGHLLTGAAGFAGAEATGSPHGAVVGMALPAIGVAAKAAENALARRALNPVDEMMRARSPLGDIMGANPVLPPLTREGVIMRALLPGLLAPQQQPQQIGPNGPPGLLGQWS